MISNPYNLSSQIGYEEILYLVKQLSNSDKAKLVREIYEEPPSNESTANNFESIKRMGKKAQSVDIILKNRSSKMAEKRIAFNVSKLNIVSIEDAKKGNYQNKMDKSAVVGKWPGDEPVEELLNMLTK